MVPGRGLTVLTCAGIRRRNMAFSDGSTGAGELALRSRKIKRSPFLVLAAGLLLFAAVVGGFLLVMRPAASTRNGDRFIFRLRKTSSPAPVKPSEKAMLRLRIPAQGLARLGPGRGTILDARQFYYS